MVVKYEGKLSGSFGSASSDSISALFSREFADVP